MFCDQDFKNLVTCQCQRNFNLCQRNNINLNLFQVESDPKMAQGSSDVSFLFVSMH